MMRAMVLAAGLGTRMRPLTEQMPKPLVPVGGKSLIDHTLDWLANAGITEVVVNSYYKAEMLEAHLAARSSLQHITISRETELLETGGGIKKALPLLGDAPFFIANSDVICLDGATPALHRLQAAWNDETMDALLLLHPVANAVGYDGKGDFFLEKDSSLRRRADGEVAPYVFTGVQLLHPRLFVGSPDGAFSLNVLFNRALEKPQRLKAIIHDGKWLHVGDVAGIHAAEAAL